MQDEDITKTFLEKNLKPKQVITRERDPDTPHGYWQETTATGKDRRGKTVCGSCGKPGGPELKTCSGCRQILYVFFHLDQYDQSASLLMNCCLSRYCSPEHQKVT